MFLKLFKAIIEFILDFIETGVIALSLFVIMYIFLFQPHQVKGNSMYPNFHDGEYLLTNKLVYRFSEPQRNDVIIFKAPQNEDYDYIKRIIAVPGDTLMIDNGHVYLNQKLLDESSYLGKEVKTSNGVFMTEGKKITIAEGEYFVMGDNRSFSSDSRDWGTVPKKNIIGKAWLRYWPLSRFGLIQHL